MRFKIHYKITVVFALLAFLMSILLYVFLTGYFKRLMTSEIRQNMTLQLKILGTILENGGVSFTHERLRDVLARLGTNHQARLTLVSREGSVVADSEIRPADLDRLQNHSNRTEIRAAWRDGFGEDRRYSVSIGRDLIYQAVPVRIGGREFVLRLAMQDPDIRLGAVNFGRTLVLFLTVIGAFAVATGFLILSFVSRPLDRIVCWLRRITGGDYQEHILVFSNDEIGLLASALNDMTRTIGLKIAEAEISRSRLERMILSMTDGILVVAPDESVMLANSSLARLLDWSEKPDGRRYYEFIRSHEIIELIDQTLKNPDAGERMLSVSTPGMEKSLEVTGIPILYEGRIDSAVFIFHDVTASKRLDVLRKDFVANASHELKTPVSVIKGYAETLLDGALEDREHAREFLTLIHTDARRLSALIDDILKLSQIESGQLTLERKPCSLRDIVNRVMTRFRHTAEQNRSRLVDGIPAEFPSCNADEDRIEEVLTNLIDNALKYSGEESTVTISAKALDGQVRVEVADTGIGIPQDKLSRLFERFYRVDPGRSRKLGGTGLGLSIVKHIIQAHGGSVDVQSSPGKGSIFGFTIPNS